jgi:molybdopterin molybdotransferase
MKRLAQARADVAAAVPLLPEVEVGVAEALGLALAADVVAPHPVPPFANSAVDGYAVLASDTRDVPVMLEVVEDVPAGSLPEKDVAPGVAIRVMTGAPMPGGADAMVMVEDTDFDEPTVKVLAPASPGDHVRRAGGDFEAGDVVLAQGDRIDAVRIGLAASIGVTRLQIRRRPRVAVLSTGDEVLSPEATALPPGAIRDSNRPMLVAALRDVGAEVLDLGIVPDDERLLRSTLEEAASDADAVVSSGGVSMGQYDLVKKVLGDLGDVDFWRVAMQPAKPFAFGFLGGTPFFGLPGNPVSVMVAFEQFVRPALLTAMGASRVLRPRTAGVMAEAVSTSPEKAVFLRVAVARQGPRWFVEPSGGQGSNILSALAAADAFAVIPVGIGEVAAGDEVVLELFRSAETRSLEEADDD